MILRRRADLGFFETSSVIAELVGGAEVRLEW